MGKDYIPLKQQILELIGESPSLWTVIDQLFQIYQCDTPLYIKFLYECDIRHEKLHRLWVYCCHQTPMELKYTIDLIVSGHIRFDDIHRNLELDNPISFIQEAGIKKVSRNYKNDNWENYCQHNADLFHNNLQEVINKMSKKH